MDTGLNKRELKRAIVRYHPGQSVKTNSVLASLKKNTYYTNNTLKRRVRRYQRGNQNP